jgi:hypothetical protein
MDDAIWDVTVFTKSRERLLDGDIAEAFFQAVLQQARDRNLLSDEHFTVDGTLLEAWASVKSYQRKDAKGAVPPDDPGNPTVDFHGEKRSNQTHASKTDPDAKMARKGKGKEAKLSYNGNLLVENRNGLINSEVFEANGTAERDAALVMLEQIFRSLLGMFGPYGLRRTSLLPRSVAHVSTRNGSSAVSQARTQSVQRACP